jgi:parallel beta-helix repeat protein
VSFKGCTFAGNAGTGLYAHRGKGKLVQNVSVTDSVVSDNGQGIAIVSVEGTSIVNNRVTGQRSKGKSGIVVGDASGARISGNQLEDNFRGIFSAGAARTDIRGNTVVGMAPGTVAGGDEASGIVCLGLPGFKDEACDVVQNTVRRCAGSGIVAQLVSRVRIHDNVVEETGRRGILLLSSTRSDVKGNEVSRNGLETPARYDAIELSQAANDNTITSNTIRLSPSVRQAIGVGPGCRGNKVDGNVVLPY